MVQPELLMEAVILILNRNIYSPEKKNMEETEGTETVSEKRQGEYGRFEWGICLIFARTSYCSCQIH